MFQDLWGQWGKFSLSWCKSDVYHLKLIKVKRGTVKSNEEYFWSMQHATHARNATTP